MGWLQRLLGVEQVRDLVSIRHGMDRRSFLKTALIGSAVAATVDVEQLLWTPKTQIVVPEFIASGPVGYGYREVERYLLGSGNVLVTPEWIAQEALHVLENNLKFTALMNRTYEYEVVGDTFGMMLNVRMEA